jgi:flagellar biosynthesis anti-sigma factor FlgM
MRIDGSFPLPESPQSDKVARSGSQTQQSSSAPVNSGQDQAQLSVGGQTIQQLNFSLSQVPEVRQERVDALRQVVSSGSYQVSDQQLSDAIGSELLGSVIG